MSDMPKPKAHSFYDVIHLLNTMRGNTHFTEVPEFILKAETIIQLARIADALESLTNIHDSLTSDIIARQ